MQPTTGSSRRSGIIALIVTVLIWATAAFVWFQRQDIYDWWRLRGYDPPADIAQLATDTTMSDSARRVFYVYHPVIEDRSTFNQHCSEGEFTIVLGCYVSNQGIYLFSIDDPRLAGVEQVTAAHELLHAAYDRLSAKERAQVNQWTEDFFIQLDDERIKTTVEQYRSKDPSSVPNELHSILGTEVRNLPGHLENYYKRYFTDRLKVVAFSEAYEGAFSSRQKQIASLESRLKTMADEIGRAKNELDAEGERLQQEYAQMEAERNGADPTSFNARVDSYNRAVRAYNQKVAQTSGKIDQYNALHAQYKDIVLEQQDLVKAIDSRPEALQTQ